MVSGSKGDAMLVESTASKWKEDESRRLWIDEWVAGRQRREVRGFFADEQVERDYCGCCEMQRRAVVMLAAKESLHRLSIAQCEDSARAAAAFEQCYAALKVCCAQLSEQLRKISVAECTARAAIEGDETSTAHYLYHHHTARRRELHVASLWDCDRAGTAALDRRRPRTAGYTPGLTPAPPAPMPGSLSKRPVSPVVTWKTGESLLCARMKLIYPAYAREHSLRPYTLPQRPCTARPTATSRSRVAQQQNATYNGGDLASYEAELEGLLDIDCDRPPPPLPVLFLAAVPLDVAAPLLRQEARHRDTTVAEEVECRRDLSMRCHRIELQLLSSIALVCPVYKTHEEHDLVVGPSRSLTAREYTSQIKAELQQLLGVGAAPIVTGTGSLEEMRQLLAVAGSSPPPWAVLRLQRWWRRVHAVLQCTRRRAAVRAYLTLLRQVEALPTLQRAVRMLLAKLERARRATAVQSFVRQQVEAEGHAAPHSTSLDPSCSGEDDDSFITADDADNIFGCAKRAVSEGYALEALQAAFTLVDADESSVVRLFKDSAQSAVSVKELEKAEAMTLEQKAEEHSERQKEEPLQTDQQDQHPKQRSDGEEGAVSQHKQEQHEQGSQPLFSSKLPALSLILHALGNNPTHLRALVEAGM